MSTSNVGKAVSQDSNSYHHGDLRRALIDASLELFATDSSFSLRALAKHVGVSPTAVYRHFADKTALENAVSARGYSMLLDEFRALSERDSAREQALEFGLCYVNFAQAHPHLFDLMGRYDCTLDEESASISREFFDYLAEHNMRLAPEVDPQVLTWTLWSLVHGVTVLGRGGVLGKAESENYRDMLSHSLALIFR
ncbi:MAG: TetR/AcrR family transcriptional regulator [Rothia sp. (in: high G+C Gram-positive bacteria)]|uniref:TetR/AcrR family transcriptional regulator n=1 Tax=Rothia sp. (in: high G+C Gram-positive bacteria) TaxID=1885016 RepID=UPI0026DF23CF|nr:TetR/AcrR family transcriptional regulator [Rothia sp. (in: high G+C Gram-positive bacteria)]MDO5750010.1 TetR/AcrR family transcriptional regulator [Rothia sp. (in: high G+C Gram-positive bacteria)]